LRRSNSQHDEEIASGGRTPPSQWQMIFMLENYNMPRLRLATPYHARYNLYTSCSERYARRKNASLYLSL
jgi:hypothetical protein